MPTKVCLVKAMVFPVVMYRCESWIIKKAECQRIDAFELWCWRRLLRVLWTARRSNQSILKEISPGISLEGMMLKLKLQYFGYPMTAAHQAPPSLGFSRQEHWSGLPFPSPMLNVKSESEVAQSCPTLSDPMDCSLPGSSAHGIFQARVLEWGAIAFSAS